MLEGAGSATTCSRNERFGRIRGFKPLFHARMAAWNIFSTEVMPIRRARRDDIAAIVRIEKASFGRQAWTRAEFLDYIAEPEECVFLVAVTDGAVAGYIVGFGYRNRAEVDSIAVSPAHRNQSIATALMNCLKRILRRRGFTTLSLTVRVDNTPAIELYRKLGFARVRRINRCYEDGAPAWRMRTSLILSAK